MKIYVLLLLLITTSAYSYMGDNSNFEVVPLHDHEVVNPGLGGGEIGNGAPYGGDDLDCKDPSNYENCYDVIQTYLVRSLEAAKTQISKPNATVYAYNAARTTLYSAIRTSITLMKNLSESGGILLPYLEKGLLYNTYFSGACVTNTSECNAIESKAAYEFLSAYLKVLLDKVYSFDLQFFLPFSARLCGYAPDGVYTAFSGYLSRYMELQREFLGLVNNIRVGSIAAPVNFQTPYYEAKLTGAVMSEVGKDIQRMYFFNVFYRNISVLDLLSAADALATQVNSSAQNLNDIGQALKNASTAINEFNRTTASYVYLSDTTIDCSLRK